MLTTCLFSLWRFLVVETFICTFTTNDYRQICQIVSVNHKKVQSWRLCKIDVVFSSNSLQTSSKLRTECVSVEVSCVRKSLYKLCRLFLQMFLILGIFMQCANRLLTKEFAISAGFTTVRHSFPCKHFLLRQRLSLTTDKEFVPENCCQTG